ncbi:MAG: ABC transporter substrate-binding protein [Streptosporangiaceae bacterium]
MRQHSLARFSAGLVGVALVAAACGGGGQQRGGSSGGGGGSSNGGAVSIALSNSYAGNSWRQQMVNEFQLAAKKAKQKGLASKTGVVNANNSASQQASQMQSMILQGYDAITVDAASTTSLNGVIKKACDAGIKVVVFDALATAPCAYKVAFNYVNYGKREVDYVAKRLHGKGNILEIRGIAGTSVDNDIHKGVVQELKKYPHMRIVGSVHGNWTESIAQKAVAKILPSLPKVDGVVDQGGDGYGTAQAFVAAGREPPIIVMGNREDEIKFWLQQHKKNGYETTSISSQPGVSAIAFWVAYELAKGAKMPKRITVPLLQIKFSDVETWIKVTPKGGVATPYYSHAWTKKLISSAKAGGSPPPQPPPGSGS